LRWVERVERGRERVVRRWRVWIVVGGVRR